MEQCLQHSSKFSQIIKYEKRMKTFLDTPGLQKFISHALFWKKLLHVELHQRKRANQGKGRYGTEERGQK